MYDEKLKEQAVELDNYARENITDYKNLSANGQASIRAVIRQGRSFGIQEDFILSCARVSARSGLSIVYSMEESFVAANGTYADGAIDLANNRIIINPEAKSRTGESILIHELTHAIYNTTNGKLKIAKGVETMTDTEKERIHKRYAQVSKGDVAVIADEINAHFAEQTLTNKNILERLVEKNPNVKKNILDFFKKAKAEYNGDKKLSGASARLYRQYKKLFDEFSMRNQRYLGVENVSSDAQAQAEDLLKRNNIQLAIKQDVDGDSFVEVDSQNDIIDESPKQIAQTLAQIVRTKFSSLIDVHGQNIGINQRTAKEWLRSKSAEKLLHTNNQMFLDKISAFKNADELLKVSKDYVGEVAKHARKDNFVEFARGVVAFKVGDNGYEADIIVGTTKSKAAILYDIVNIQYKRIVADTTNTAQDRRGVVSTTNSSIFKNSENVNPHEKKLGKSEKKRYVLSETDSNGKQLSSKQYEFFKNTKITDSFGNLLVLYHQTDADFTVFDPLREGAGTRDSETPHGIFMKPTADDIGLSGSKQMPLYANIQKPLIFIDRTQAQRHWRTNIEGYGDIINQINANDVKYNEEFEEAFNLERVAQRKKVEHKNLNKEEQDIILEESESESEEILNKWETENEILEKQAKKLIDDYLKNSEYDGVILEYDAGSFGRKVRTIIALHPNQVKNTNNVAPTKAEDIRFALPVDRYTEKQYNDYGWVRANEVLTKRQWADFNSKFAKAINGEYFPKTKGGEYIIAVNKRVDAVDGVNNVLVYVRGTMTNPKISKILKIDRYNETELDNIRREIYASERRGIQREAGKIFRYYTSVDFEFFGREGIKSQSNSERNRFQRGRSSRETTRIKAIHFNDDGSREITYRDGRKETRYALDKTEIVGANKSNQSNGGYSVGQRAKFSANNTAMRVYTKAEAREVINSISP